LYESPTQLKKLHIKSGEDFIHPRTFRQSYWRGREWGWRRRFSGCYWRNRYVSPSPMGI